MSDAKRPTRSQLENVRAYVASDRFWRDPVDVDAVRTLLDAYEALTAAPEPVTADPSAPIDKDALPDWWDARRRAQGKPDLSRCAAELRRALAAEPRPVTADESVPAESAGEPSVTFALSVSKDGSDLDLTVLPDAEIGPATQCDCGTSKLLHYQHAAACALRAAQPQADARVSDHERMLRQLDALDDWMKRDYASFRKDIRALITAHANLERLARAVVGEWRDMVARRGTHTVFPGRDPGSDSRVPVKRTALDEAISVIAEALGTEDGT